MRLTLLTTLVAFGAVACGGEKKADASQAQAATPAPAAATPAAPAAPAAAVVEVKMTGNGTTKAAFEPATLDRKSTRLNSSHITISYAVFCLKKKKTGEKGRTTAQRNYS